MFMLMFDRRKQNSVKQLSFNLKKWKKKTHNGILLPIHQNISNQKLWRERASYISGGRMDVYSHFWKSLALFKKLNVNLSYLQFHSDI